MACINTKAGKLKRALALREHGYELYPWRHREPYITWEDLLYAVENSLQLSEKTRIFNSERSLPHDRNAHD